MHSILLVFSYTSMHTLTTSFKGLFSYSARIVCVHSLSDTMFLTQLSTLLTLALNGIFKVV